MKKFLLAVIVLAGCQPEPSLTPQHIELLGECFSCAAYEVIKAEALTPVPQPPQKCCGKCKGGLVKSGDGLAWVSCPCDDSCPCKTNSLIPPKTLP